MRAVRNFWVHTSVLLVALLLACSLIWAGPIAAAPLGQAGTGTVTGQVLSLDDVPLAAVRLAAYSEPQTNPNRVPLAEFRSDAQGQYSIDLPPGQVWMSFLTQDILGESFWGYDNLPITVVAGQTISGQDFRVAIRIVSEPEPPTAVPATAVPVPTAAPEPPGMPTTGTGPDPQLPLVGALGLLLLAFGLALRRRVPR
jgi:MYXO-CTERM domain-containing protein